MATGKTTTLTFRIKPALQEGLRAAAGGDCPRQRIFPRI